MFDGPMAGFRWVPVTGNGSRFSAGFFGDSFPRRPRQGEQRSGKTQGYSPASAIWMDDGKVMEVYAFDPDQSLNRAVPEGWKDARFDMFRPW